MYRQRVSVARTLTRPADIPFGYSENRKNWARAKDDPMPDDLRQAKTSTDAAAQHELDPETLAHDNAGWMLKLAERLVRDRTLAEDVVQDALIRAINGRANFEHRSSVKTWLRRITVNTALSKLHQLQRLAEQPIDEHLPEFDRYDCRIEPAWSHLASVDEITQSDQLREYVFGAIGQLPDAYRLVLQLRDIEGYDTAEVAELLELSKTNVKVRLHRARAALKKLLEPVLRGEVP